MPNAVALDSSSVAVTLVPGNCTDCAWRAYRGRGIIPYEPLDRPAVAGGLS